jgi:undecaprenyl-diphosphatase
MTTTAPVPAPLGRRVLREVEATDLAVYRAIAATPTPTLDAALKRLSRAADHSVLWLSIAGALAVVPGAPRRAALLGVASIGVTSAAVNVVAKEW